MKRIAEYFKNNQVDIVMALYAMNMTVNPYQGYDLTRIMKER